MSTTLNDLCEHLKTIDEIDLVEKLNITSEDLVDRFEDRITDKFDELVGEDEDE